jgi:cobalt-zinc-cadmium efflux system outer membrane protein
MLARFTLSTFLAFTAVCATRAAAVDVPPSPTLPPALDLDTALKLVRERGLDVLAAEAGAQGAEGDLHAAAAIPNPTLSATYGRSAFFGGCNDATGNACPSIPEPALSAGLSDNAALFDVFIGKRRLKRDVARAALAAARLQRDDALRNLEGQTKAAFVQVLVARDTLRFDEEVAASQRHAATLSRARFENGAISEADLARIDTAALEAEQAVDGARSDLRSAQVALAFLLGVRGAVPEFDVVAGPLEGSAVPGALASATREGLVARALDGRPDVLAARRQAERAGVAVTLAGRQRIPDVTLSFDYAQQGTTPSAVTPPTFTVGLSLPIPLFYQQQGEIRRAEADRSAQSLAVARAEATAVTDVETAWAVYVAARARVQRMEGGLLERARTARDLVTIQYQKGATSLLDLLDAQRTFIATRVEYLQDLGAYWTAIFKLEQAAGVALR